MSITYVWAVYSPQEKSFLRSAGYYGNEFNILAFESKEQCEKYCLYKGYRPKRMRIK